MGPSQRLATTLSVANTQNNSGLNQMLNFSHCKTLEGPCRGYVLCSTGPKNQLLSSCCTFHSQGPRTAAGVLAVTSMSQEGMRGPSPLKATEGMWSILQEPEGHLGVPVSSQGTCVLPPCAWGTGAGLTKWWQLLNPWSSKGLQGCGVLKRSPLESSESLGAVGTVGRLQVKTVCPLSPFLPNRAAH